MKSSSKSIASEHDDDEEDAESEEGAEPTQEEEEMDEDEEESEEEEESHKLKEKKQVSVWCISAVGRLGWFTLVISGMLTLELSAIVLEIPNDAYKTHSIKSNPSGYSTLSQEYCKLNG